MTQQQERIQQARHHEYEAKVVRAGRKVMKTLFKLTGGKLVKYQRYLERTARQNRRAHERNSH